jgi:anti-sigma regulatory factor (Ser/Thr protein kinase)
MTTLRFRIAGTSYVAEPRRAAVERARDIGFDESDAGRVALVATEMATNIAQHAGEGELLVVDTSGHPPAIELLAIDKGPGIADLARATEDGYSTAGTLGHGLGSMARQADEFQVFTQQPGGTVTMARILPSKAAPTDDFLASAVSVPYPEEVVCGDAWSLVWRRSQGELLVVDGLGHGMGASEAALEAVRVFKASRSSSPPELVEELHAALRHTRGAALAVAAIDLEAQAVKYSGLGNIGAIVVTPERTRINMASQNGTAGHAARRIIEFSYPFRSGSTLVMFTDGMTQKFDVAAYARLWSHDPAVVAGVLYRDCSRGRDDVTVVVARQRSAT